MTQEELQKTIAEYYLKLPKESQEMFSRMEWLETLKRISIKYGLTEEQTKTLGTETTLILLGITGEMEYGNLLRNELKMASTTLDDMLLEIKRSILGPVASQITDTYQKNAGEEAERGKIETELDERFTKLPQEVQKAIIESNYYDNLYTVTKGYNLNVGQMAALEEITNGIIGGTVNASLLEERLRDKVELSEEEIKRMTVDLNEKVLRKIREKMVGIKKPTETSSSPNKVVPEETTLKRSEEVILNKAGIKIAPTPVTSENKKPDQIIRPANTLEQKFAGAFKSPSTQTDHSLSVLSKSTVGETASPKDTSTDSAKEESVSTPLKTYTGKDPYRLSPDE
jgi:hypothetical protein